MTLPNIVWSPARMATRVLVPCIIALVLMVLPRVAHAGTIIVDGTTCTLPEAITAANTDSAFNGCSAGSGPDTLLLGGLTHSLATGPYLNDDDSFVFTATPSVTTTIVISGGVGGAIVERSGVDQYRLFHVADTGNLTLQKVTVRNGDTDVGGGAIFNLGKLDLIDTNLIANTAGYGGGLASRGTATLTNSDFISNTAPYGGGLYNSRTVTLTNSNFISNTARVEGGGFNNYGTATLTNSHFISNTAGYGGGLYNRGTVTLTNADFISNTVVYEGGGGISNRGTATLTNASFISNTAGYGGGFHNYGTATLTNADFIFNTARAGGGLYTSGTITLTNSYILSNTARSGGGISNFGTATLTNADIRSNTAADGGGFYNDYRATLTNSHFIANTAGDGGGGLYNSGTITLTNSDILSNTAAYGGGFYSNGYASTAITITNATIRANIAITSGGAIYKQGVGINPDSGNTTIIGSRFIGNHAGITGGTIHQLDGTTTIEQSCIVNNSDNAINYGDGVPIDAANNWWGAPDGPGGVGSGTGDSVSIGVNFAPFLTTPVAGCPWLTAMVTASTTEATVGETITFTYHITNSSSLTLTTISAVDDQFGPVEALEGELMPAASRTVTFTHVVEPSDLPGPLTSSVTVTGTDTFDLVVTASDSISVTTLPAVLQPGEIYLPNVQR